MNQRVLLPILRIILIFGLLFPSSWSSSAQDMPAPLANDEYVPGEILVKFQPGVVPTNINGDIQVGVATLDTLLYQYGINMAAPLFSDAEASAWGLERIYKLSLNPNADLLALVAALSGDTAIEYAEPNYILHTFDNVSMTTKLWYAGAYWVKKFHTFAKELLRQPGSLPAGPPRIPTDRRFANQWALHNTRQTGGTEDADIDTPEAWSVMTGTSNIMIAVIDSGIDYTHEDLNDGRVRTDIDKDYINNDNDALDDNGHGTHVAGTVAARTNNGAGVAGIMWQAKLLPLKVCNSKGNCNADHIAAAIRYAANQGARVINMSLGGSCSQTIADAVNYAYFDKGVVIVAAAGNNGGSIGYPAQHAPVIAVGATDHNDSRAYFSSYGDELDVVAPGVTILSTVPQNGYDTFSGTSMAAPHVAGVVGLLLAQRPELKNSQVHQILRTSADDLGQSGFDRHYGFGRVNAYQALQTATPSEPAAPERAVCSGCGATVALADQADGASLLSNLRALRDKVFTQNPGRRWSQIYYVHQSEVAWLLVSDDQLRTDAIVGIRAFDPVFQALLDEQAVPVQLTADLIEIARHVLIRIAEQGSPTMHNDMLREWERISPDRFVGWDVRAVWEQLRQEEQPNLLYLPTILR